MKKLVVSAWLFKSHVSSYTKTDGTFVAEHEDKRLGALPAGYKIEKKKLNWQEPEQFHVYHESKPHTPVASRYSEVDAVSSAIEYSARNQVQAPAGKVVTQANPKKSKMILDKESGFMFPASGVEPMIHFHNSSEKDGFTVKDSIGGNGGIDFGGIFAGPKAGMSGEFVHAVVLDPTANMSHGDLLRYHSWAVIDKNLKKLAPHLSKSEREELFDYVSEDKDVFDLSDSEKMNRLFGASDPGYASWEAQSFRGKLAGLLGYKSADMRDETGISTFVCPGAKTYPLQDGEKLSEAEARIHGAWERWASKGARRLTKSILLCHADLLK